MTTGAVYITIILLIVSATACWSIIFMRRLRWWLRAGLISLTFLAVSTTYIGLKTMYGYPYDSYPPTGKHLFLSYWAEESTKQDDGYIAIWMIPGYSTSNDLTLLERISWVINDRQPRVFVVEYSKEMHEELDKVRAKNEGKPTMIEIGEKGDTEREEKKKPGEGTLQKFQSETKLEQEFKGRFYVLPLEIKPRKEAY
tara:strand:- start:165 stop:758 length:594 start_codon:yes stop_codon:yes gene_type:complete